MRVERVSSIDGLPVAEGLQIRVGSDGATHVSQVLKENGRIVSFDAFDEMLAPQEGGQDENL